MSTEGQRDAPGTTEELVFRVIDSSYPFVRVSAEAECRVELQKLLPRKRDRYVEFFSIDGADPGRVVELAAEDDRIEPALLSRHEDGGLFEFVVSDGCPARHLAEQGALPKHVESTDGTGRIVAEVPPGYDAAEVTAEFADEHPSAELIAKREKAAPTPLFTARELERAVDERLTDRQREVLRAAYEAGYYERPRETTGAKLADDLGITSATFSQHIRAAERNLLEILYEERAL